jgi:hypothetical protein
MPAAQAFLQTSHMLRPAQQPQPQQKGGSTRISLMPAHCSVLLHLLRRWFSTEQVEVPEAQHLDIILYSREQLVKEYAAMPSKGDGEHLPNVPWGIISVKVRRCWLGLIDHYGSAGTVVTTPLPRVYGNGVQELAVGRGGGQCC